jgi:hypothetical protein
MSYNFPPLPEEAINRLFDRLTAVYGAQKMSSMWTGADPEEVKRTWGRTLSKYPRPALKAAADAVGEECGAWPPTLTEFVALVRSKVQAPEHRPALPVPKRTDAEVQAGAEQMRKIRAMLGNAVRRMPE